MADSGKCPSFDDDEAKARFKKTKSTDPFPDIAPALLNSADIHDYIEATGMISPYYPDCLKSASYEAQIGDRAVYWDDKGKRQNVVLSKGKSVRIQPNSLIYLTTKQKFRLPDYIAVRFNLRITNVHRGLLLGTGPLVDPGFEGQLVIPLHNFTTNPYVFEGGEGFIWIEFTKISPNNRWMTRNKKSLTRSRDYEIFPEDKKYKSIEYYLRKASPHYPIRNAIPAALAEAEVRAEKAVKIAEKAGESVERIRNLGIGAIVFAILTVVLTIFFGLLPLFNDFSDLAVNTTALVTDAQSEVERSQHTTEAVEQRLLALDKKIESLQQQLDRKDGSAPANPDQQ